MKELRIHPTIIAALIMSLTLSFGLGKMNLIHHEILPNELLQQEVVEKHAGFFSDRYDIYMEHELQETDAYKSILKTLANAHRSDTIVFHLAGVGGPVETAFELIDAVKQSKAHVIMDVIAPVYSGHAYLASMGDELIMEPYSSLMFHTSSGYGTDCSQEQGTDRTVSNVEHCQSFLTNHFALMNRLINLNPVMTAEEKVAVATGHDVYITADEYNKRTGRPAVL